MVKGTIGQPSEQRELMLRKRLKDLNLKTGPEGYVKERRDPVAIWINQARRWARNRCLMGGSVHIDMVVRSLPLPDGVDRRAIGGVFKHPDFKRIGTNRTRKQEVEVLIVIKNGLILLRQIIMPACNSPSLPVLWILTYWKWEHLLRVMYVEKVLLQKCLTGLRIKSKWMIMLDT